MSETFSKNLRKLRHEKNLTQEQVADRLCVSAQSVSRWETGLPTRTSSYCRRLQSFTMY